LKALLASSALPQLVNQFVPDLIKRVGMDDKDAAQKMEFLYSVIAPMSRHPTALYFAGIDFQAPRGPRPKMAVLCDAGNESAPLFERINGLANMLQGGAPFPVKALKEGNLVALAFGYDPFIMAGAPGGGEAISKSPAFQAAIGQVNKEPVAIIYA